MREKKKKEPQCSQCGRKRGVLRDPCSEPCRAFKANHDELMARIAELEKEKR